jgi:hypothetical protein
MMSDMTAYMFLIVSIAAVFVVGHLGSAYIKSQERIACYEAAKVNQSVVCE